MVQAAFYWYGWLFVRPRRWFFWKMMAEGSFGLRWLPRKNEYWTIESAEFYRKYRWPNPHWWLLYQTVFQFCKWLYWDGWRPFAKWGPRMLDRHTFLSKALQTLGRTTAGYTCSGGECYHCGSAEGDQVDLADDETGTTFILEETWSVGTQDGTDYRFRGITICPKCGYRGEYEDGSL